jgi:hypothetical protein
MGDLEKAKALLASCSVQSSRYKWSDQLYATCLYTSVDKLMIDVTPLLLVQIQNTPNLSEPVSAADMGIYSKYARQYFGGYAFSMLGGASAARWLAKRRTFGYRPGVKGQLGITRVCDCARRHSLWQKFGCADVLRDGQHARLIR